MKFTIHKQTLVKMLKILSGGWVKKMPTCVLLLKMGG
jgi:hypothetical protein